MHVCTELCQPSYLDRGSGIVGSVRREYSSVTVVGAQKHELGENLCVPGGNVVSCGVHLPMIGIVLISDGENGESEEVRELKGHDLPTGLRAVG